MEHGFPKLQAYITHILADVSTTSETYNNANHITLQNITKQPRSRNSQHAPSVRAALKILEKHNDDKKPPLKQRSMLMSHVYMRLTRGTVISSHTNDTISIQIMPAVGSRRSNRPKFQIKITAGQNSIASIGTTHSQTRYPLKFGSSLTTY